MPHVVYEDSQSSTIEHFGEGSIQVWYSNRRGVQMRRIVDEYCCSTARMMSFEFSPGRLQFGGVSSMKDDVAPPRKEFIGNPALQPTG